MDIEENPILPHSFVENTKITKKKVNSVLILVNPNAGSGKGEECGKKARELFLSKNIEVSLVALQGKGHCEDLCRHMDLRPYDVLCIVGGDGTIHETINGLMTRSDNEKSRIALGLIPAGTGNSFALEIQICSNVSRSVARIIRGASCAIDVAKVTCHCQHAEDDEHTDMVVYAFNSIHWGLASQVNVTAERLRWMGRATRYTSAALLELTRGEKERVNVTIVDAEGKSTCYEDELCLSIANNIVSAAEGMRMAPNAKLNDGLIDLILVRSSNTFDLISMFRKVYAGTHTELPYVEYQQVKKFSIRPLQDKRQGEPDQVIEELLDIDGELKGFSPFSCEVVPLAIHVII